MMREIATIDPSKLPSLFLTERRRLPPCSVIYFVIAVDGTVGLSFHIKRQFKAALDEAAKLRGHTVSEAAERMLRLGMPIYLKRVPKKFERVEAA